jgi:hypothetical protein
MGAISINIHVRAQQAAPLPFIHVLSSTFIIIYVKMPKRFDFILTNLGGKP